MDDRIIWLFGGMLIAALVVYAHRRGYREGHSDGYIKRVGEEVDAEMDEEDQETARAPAEVKESSREAFPFAIVGESHYQAALNGIVKELREGSGGDGRAPVVAELRPEPDNPVDPEAIQVTIERLPVGYLKKADARRLAELVGHGVTAKGVIRGGRQLKSGIRTQRGVFLAPPTEWKQI